MTDIKQYSDNEIIPSLWRGNTLKLFISAIEDYKRILEPHSKAENELIKRELYKLDTMLTAFNEHLKKLQGDFGTSSMNFDGDYLKTLHAILWQYKFLKEAELINKEKEIQVRGAFEYKQKEINEIADILSLPIWQHVERKMLLVDSFIPKTLRYTPQQENTAIESATINEPQKNNYIKEEIIQGFISKQDEYNYKKLINLLNELNQNYRNGNAYTSSMVIRSILDHIPPLLGYYTFNEVVSNYTWGDTDQKYINSLLEFKNEGDDALHRRISSDPDLLDIEDLPSPVRLNRLMQECLSNGGKVLFSRLKTKEGQSVSKSMQKNIEISLLEQDVKWANWGMRNLVWSSYQFKLKIDNYKSKLPDYVSIVLEAFLVNGEKWLGKHFIFEGVNKQDEELRIEQYEQKNITVYISDQRANNDRLSIPQLKENTMKLIINTKSGNKFEFQIKDDWVTRG